MALVCPAYMQFKVVLIGDPSVGKSNLSSRLCKNEFSYELQPPIGFQWDKYHMKDEDKSINITANIWDVAGQERFESLRGSYYRDANAAVIVYDITRKETFKNVKIWLKDLRDHKCQNIEIMLVGAKADQRHLRAVKTEIAKAYAERENFLFMETSALESFNVENAFKTLLTHIHHKKKALYMANNKAVDIDNDPMRQTVNHGGDQDMEFTRIPRLFRRVNDLVMASASYSQDNGLITKAPRLSSDNFSIWKNRMIAFLNFVDSNLMETIKEGRHKPLSERSRWSDEDIQKVALDNKAMNILIGSLPDDIYCSVMNSESAKEMWGNLIVLFEGTDDTMECRRTLLIHQYECFTHKPGESLTDAYIRFKCLINDLRQHHEFFCNDEMLIKFLRGLPVAWNTMSMIIRQTKNLKTMSLESLYGSLLTHELEIKHDACIKENMAVKDKVIIQPINNCMQPKATVIRRVV